VLRIDRLRIQLPHHLRDQAAEVGRLVGEELARVDPGPARRVRSLRAPVVRVARDASARDVAGAVARSIATSLRASTSSQGGAR
jgi:hypothetical protein